jgi:plasmid stabilization system protein ParE
LKFEVRLSKQAERDLVGLVDFLRDASPRAADAAYAAIEEALLSLAELPNRGRPSQRRPQHREIVVRFGRYGYILQYRVDAKHVVVARIKDSRRRR